MWCGVMQASLSRCTPCKQAPMPMQAQVGEFMMKSGLGSGPQGLLLDTHGRWEVGSPE